MLKIILVVLASMAFMVTGQAANATAFDLTGHVRIEITGKTPIEITYDVRKPNLDSCEALKKEITQNPLEIYSSSKAYRTIGVNILHGNIGDSMQNAGVQQLFEEKSLGGAVDAVKVVHLGCYPVNIAN